jgi:hypothetical protein
LYPLLGASAGWLGVALSRGALERQEALYRATAALYAVEMPRGTLPPPWARTSRVRTGSG